MSLLDGYQIPQIISTGLLQQQLNTILADIYSRLVGPAASGSVATTDATSTTVLTYPTASNKSYQLFVRITGRRTGGSSGAAGDSAAFRLGAAFKNVAGTLSQVGSDNLTVVGRDQAAWTAQTAVSGTNVLVKVSGAANNNVSWSLVGTMDAA